MDFNGIIPVIILIGAWISDLMLGDPANIPHPIVYFGKWIAWGEKRLNKGSQRLLKGALFSAGSTLLTYFIAASILRFIQSWSLVAYVIISVILLFFCLAGTTLIREVKDVFLALDESLEKGRAQVARIVGRDTQNLSAQEVRTAALETLAENLSDGVIAPLFWYLLLGVPGALTYKMVNTFDSMVGYQNERYKDFGCWAAKTDDVFNYIPARLTALCMVLVSGKRILTLLKFVLKFSRNHASPNSGWPESALAGILECRFGGPHDYFGELFYKPYIGTNARPLYTSDMRIAVGINRKAEVLFICIMLVILLA